jgi:hypothetical protein
MHFFDLHSDPGSGAFSGMLQYIRRLSIIQQHLTVRQQLYFAARFTDILYVPVVNALIHLRRFFHILHRNGNYLRDAVHISQ